MPWWLDINQIFDHFLNWVTTSILNCFDAIFSLIAKGLLITPDVTGLPQVQGLSGKSVWVVDTVFVLAFIAAGALTITAGGDERARYTAKDLAPRLVVGFIAAHFSQIFASQAITLANGQSVIVEGTYDSTTSTITATSVTLNDYITVNHARASGTVATTDASAAATVAGRDVGSGSGGTLPSKRTSSTGSIPARRASSIVVGAHRYGW